MKKRDLINIEDFSEKEIGEILLVARSLKWKKGRRSQELAGKSVALVFQKPSNRTRVSFEVGIWQLGGNCVYLNPQEIQLGVRETVADVAKTLSRFVDGIVARTNTHEDVEGLARFASVPVINGLSDLQHPCQALADLLTVQEKFKNFKDLTLAYVGDGNNNVCHSLLLGAALVGLNMNVATPGDYAPNKTIVQKAQRLAKATGAKILCSGSPQEAVSGAHVIYADTFVSMGQEAETAARLKTFKDFQVNEQLAKLAYKNYVFMHCLPAHRGQEVTEAIIDGKHSVIFDQAENRLHAQKAVLKFLLGKGKE